MSPHWLRLRPGFADVWLAALCAVLLAYTALGTGVSLLKDAATGCHIRTGDYILDHGTVPRVDFLSFSKEGQPWFAWEWLADLGMAVVHRLVGLPGLAALTALLIAATFFVLARHALALGAGGVMTLLAAQLSFAAASVHFIARPHVLTFLFLALAMLWLHYDRERGPLPYGRGSETDGRLSNAPRFGNWWHLPALTVVWVNVHAGFVALLISLGLLVAGALLERRWALFWRYLRLSLYCLAASLLNPYGWAEHWHIVNFLSQGWVRGFVEEHGPLTLDSPVFTYAVVMGSATLWLVYRWSQRREWLHTPLLLAWMAASARSVRNVPLWALLLVPLLAAELSRTLREVRWLHKLDEDYRGPLSAVSATALALALLLPPALRYAAPAMSYPPSTAPTAFVDAEAQRLAGRRLFTLDSWADYVSYRLYPRSRVFVDGRTDLFGQRLLEQYRETLLASPGWQQNLADNRVEAALLPDHLPLARALRAAAGWRVEIERDGVVLFARYDGPRESHETDSRAVAAVRRRPR